MSARHKKWSTENFDKRRAYSLKRSFGITLGQYQTILEKQNHCCYICQRHETEFLKKLAVDHDHQTGEIRGLLCPLCNKNIIGRQRDPKIFERAAEYLKGPFTGWVIPPKKKRKKRGTRPKRTK